MPDGAAKIAPLFTEAQRFGTPAVGMTDHGNMWGADEFYRQSTQAGLKPVIGIEVSLAPESRFHDKPVFWDRRGGDVSGGGAYTRTTMVAENAAGLRNLFRLSSLASLEGCYRKPRMDREPHHRDHRVPVR